MTPEQILSQEPLALTQEQRQFYFDNGYLLVENIISQEWLQRLLEVVVHQQVVVFSIVRHLADGIAHPAFDCRFPRAAADPHRSPAGARAWPPAAPGRSGYRHVPDNLLR